jgi:FkbM family methyltransferase
MMARWRTRAASAFVAGSIWVNKRLFPSEALGAPYDQVRVLTGPLRGMRLGMPHRLRASWVLGTYQSHVLGAMQRYVAPGSVAYDIGANMGYMTLAFSRLVGPAGRVFSFEPDPTIKDNLFWNLQANRIRNVTVCQIALSDKSGTATFALFSYVGVGHIAREDTPADAQLITVPAQTLDEFVYQDGHPVPSFIKIDVEGGEEGVLRGAARLLPEARPVVVAEVSYGAAWERVSALMDGYGYTPQVLGGGVERMARDGIADVLFLPRSPTG